MLKFATVLSITALAAGSALADDGYGGHNCGAYKSPQASVPSVNTAQTYSLPATTTVEVVEAPVVLDAAPSFETVQVVSADTYVSGDTMVLPVQ